MNVSTIPRDDPRYPNALELCLPDEPPDALHAIGNPDILDHGGKPTLALFCSSKCPGRLIDKTYDLTQKLRDQGYTVLSGFHSPMEKECLNVLIRSPHPVVVCPARSILNMRIPGEWQPALTDTRMLILSPFDGGTTRPTAATAQVRNTFVAALADRVLIAHATPGGKLAKLARTALAWGKPVHTLEDEANAHLTALGAEPLMV